jgi:hypothetical protein
VHDLQRVRLIALWLRYLSQKLKAAPPKNAGKSPEAESTEKEADELVNRLAELLTKHNFVVPRGKKLDKGLVRRLWQGHIIEFNNWHLDRNLKVIQSVLTETRPGEGRDAGNFPRALEQGHASELAEAIQQPLPFERLHGNLRAPDRDIRGVWRLFFIPTVGDPGTKEEVRGFVAVIPDPPNSMTSADVLVVGQHLEWKGNAVVTPSHLYLLGVRDQIDLGFFISNMPTRDHPFMFGIATTIQKELKASGKILRPVESYCFFGEKWDGNASTDDDKKAIDEYVRGDTLDEAVIPTLRSNFCQRPYKTLEELEADYPQLVGYVRTVAVNGNNSWLLPSGLHVAWT